MDELKLYDLFKQLFPLFDVIKFSKVGDCSIQVFTSVPGMAFIFTFKSISDWRLETTSMYGHEVIKEIEENEF